MPKFVCKCTGFCYEDMVIEADDIDEAELIAQDEFPTDCIPDEVACNCEEVR